jgi:hypothetical protein
MDQWAYFNTSVIKNNWDKTLNVLPPYNVPTVATGTTTSIVPFDVMVRVTKDDMIYGTYDSIIEYKVATVTPNEDGTWELPLDEDGTWDSIMSMLSSAQVVKLIFRYNDEVIHEQKLYYPRIFVDSAQTSISRSVASVFDIGGFYDRQPCMVVNMEQDYALIGRYMESQFTSTHTYVEYSTSTDSVLVGPNFVLYGSDDWGT